MQNLQVSQNSSVQILQTSPKYKTKVQNRSMLIQMGLKVILKIVLQNLQVTSLSKIANSPTKVHFLQPLVEQSEISGAEIIPSLLDSIRSPDERPPQHP